MYSKAQIWNLALNSLLLSKQIIDVDTDMSIEAKVLRLNWDLSFRQALQDMDLDATSSQATLELVEADPTTMWSYSYKYPSDCSLFRRIISSVVKDTRSTHIAKRITNKNGIKVIFTNEQDAVAEYLSHNVSLGVLSASAGLTIALRLAYNSAPLVVGKGAKELRKSLLEQYIIARAEAQEHDRLENANFDDEITESEFVAERLS